MAVSVALFTVAIVDLAAGGAAALAAIKAVRSDVQSPAARLLVGGIAAVLAAKGAHWFMMRNQATLFADPLFDRQVP